MTDLLNNMKKLEKEISKASQQNQSLCLALCEVDNLENIYQTYGQGTGDFLLRRVKQHIRSELRFFDSVGHKSTNEILLVFNCSEENAKKIFERLRLSVESTSFYYEQTIIKITISCGFTVYVPSLGEGNSRSLLETADKALSSAKNNGQNAVVCFTSNELSASEF